MSDFVIEEGLPYPLGATWSGNGTNFTVFSATATKVEVCLFDGERETHRFELPEYQVFHCGSARLLPPRPAPNIDPICYAVSAWIHFELEQ
jgi:pullulanase/glycogen debranching enzyme